MIYILIIPTMKMKGVQKKEDSLRRTARNG